eukprot:2300053-Amphidinium_carterae.1
MPMMASSRNVISRQSGGPSPKTQTQQTPALEGEEGEGASKSTRNKRPPKRKQKHPKQTPPKTEKKDATKQR